MNSSNLNYSIETQSNLESNSIERILIVGFGSAGRRHYTIANSLFPDSSIKVMKTSQHQSLQDSSVEFIYTKKELIDFSPQIAVVANPATEHISISNILREVGAHVLIEKPISNSIEGVFELIRAFERDKRVLMVGYNLRYLKSLVEFRRLVQSGHIGEVFSVRCEVGEYLPNWRGKGDYRSNVSARKELGGGVLLELSHEIDYLMWIFGEFDWVNARICNQSNLEIDVEDTVHAWIGIIPNKSNEQLVISLNMDFIRHDRTRNCLAIGESGTLKWDAIQGTVAILRSGESEWQTVFDESESIEETYVLEWSDFVECVLRSKRPRFKPENALKVLRLIDAARRSSQEARQIFVEPTQTQI